MQHKSNSSIIFVIFMGKWERLDGELNGSVFSSYLHYVIFYIRPHCDMS